MTEFRTRPEYPRRRWWFRPSSHRLASCLIALLIGLLPATGAVPAGASAPVDHRSTAPNQSSELPGAGYLLTDPLQGRSRAYWAGAYRTIAGQRAYCIDDFYDYPNPSYRYVAPEVSAWAGRPGSNVGARGHTAQRIIWIVNSYGQSSSPGTDAAVSMSINLLTGSAPFLRSYRTWFRPQLSAINPAIITLINRMLTDSDRYAGPYRTRIAFGPAPAVGGLGEFTVEVRSAHEVPVPLAHYRVLATAGIRLHVPRSGRVNSTGVAMLTYTPLRAGPLSVMVAGAALPNTTMRLGYSPSHNTSDFSTGSQRVALVSAHRLADVRPAASKVVVRAPAIRTAVVGGTGRRPVGVAVTDRVQAAGLVPKGSYQLSVHLQDSSGSSCGTASRTVRADLHGRFDLHSPPIATCGTGVDTFTERLIDLHGHQIAVSPPGQPVESFPVAPTLSTAVIDGLGPRPAGALVRDRVRGTGLPAGQQLQVQASLVDAAGRHCGTVTGTVRAARDGTLDYRTAALPACGSVRNTFTEVIRDHAGTVIVSTPAGQPSETFPLAARPSTQPPSTQPPSTVTSRPPAGRSPVPTPTPSGPRPVAGPKLASTGSAPTLAMLSGLAGVALGLSALLLGRRRS